MRPKAKSVQKSASQAAPRRRDKGAKKRSEIIRVAAELFSKHGYSGTTLTDIAEAAGTQAGSLYYHFASREDIVREVLLVSMTSINDRVIAAWDGLSEDASVVEKVTSGIRAHLHSILSGDPYLAAYDRIINEVPHDIRQEFLEQPRLYGTMWKSLLERGQERGEIRADLDPSILRLLLLGSVTWTHLWFNSSGRMSVDDVAKILTEMFLYGVTPSTMTVTISRNILS